MTRVNVFRSAAKIQPSNARQMSEVIIRLAARLGGANRDAPDGLSASGTAGNWTSYAFDPQGSVAQRLNSSQSITSSSYYDAYGQEYTSGSPGDRWAHNAQSGYYVDRQTGKCLLGHRYYDWSAGRFLTRDPIGPAGGMNLYGYCGDGPTTRSDPSGLIIPVLVVIGGAALIGGICGMMADPQHPLQGFAQGALIGGVGATVAIFTGGAATAGLGALGVGGVAGGITSGAVGGAAGSLAGQGLASKLGWQPGISWSAVGLGAAGGAAFGSLAVRPVPAFGEVTVTHWGSPSPWVQVGGPSALNRALAGWPEGEACTCEVNASRLLSPTGIEFGKGFLGQRILK